jgi:hypothetical protein
MSFVTIPRRSYGSLFTESIKATPENGGGQGACAAMARSWSRPKVHEMTSAHPSTATRQAELAVGACLVVIALVLAKVPYLLSLSGTGAVQNPVEEAVFQALGIPFAAVGALIAARRPSNRIGWLLLIGALSISSAQLAWTYVLAAHYHGGRLIYLVGWLGNWLPWPAFAVLILLLLLFPNGRLLSRHWRPVAWAAVTWSSGLGCCDLVCRDDVPLGPVPRTHRRPAAAESDRAHR